jgi:hypothetical protein
MTANSTLLDGCRSADAIADGLVRLDLDARTLSVGDQQRPLPAHPEHTGDLTAWLYAALHAGNPNVFAPASILPDVEFEEQIRASVTDAGILVPVDRVRPGERGGHLAELHRVRLLLTEAELEPGTGLARISALRPNLSPGFFMYLGNHHLAPRVELTRYYLGADSGERALAVWSESIARLTEAGVSFRSKILSRRPAYPRNDAIVYYVPDVETRFEQVMAEVLAGQGGGFSRSPLCVPHPTGLSMAHEPRDPRPGRQQRSFGEHRCGAIAEAVIEAAQGSMPLTECLVNAFESSNIDPRDVARNLQAA